MEGREGRRKEKGMEERGKGRMKARKWGKCNREKMSVVAEGRKERRNLGNDLE